MLLRFIVKNIYSFKEETEFNLFPSSRATHHLHHIKECNHAKALRLSAIYGANGAGKSNLIKSIVNFRTIVFAGGVNNLDFKEYKYKLDRRMEDMPISMAIEFFYNEKIYYYSIEFDNNIVLYENLSISERTSDELIFERVTNESQVIKFGKGYDIKPENKVFADVLQNKLLNKSYLLLSFMANNYADEFFEIKDVYNWILNRILVVGPNAMVRMTADFLDKNSPMMEMAQQLLPELKTGIDRIGIKKNILDESRLSEDWKETINELKANPGKPIAVPNRWDSRITGNVVYEDNKVILKEIQPFHKLLSGEIVEFPISSESDGTIRLIDYIPLIYFVLAQDSVILIDEIEQSLHPILIKEIMRKLSENNDVKGQLIFTTHESCLLDQKIFRPDEIWFTEKDIEGATHMYPLSDFKIHKTADIEHGYLIGRYGGIPFLSNLKDLNW